MKVILTVLSAGKAQGQEIPITLSQFVIGRDPQCQLRPASALISKRHCAVLVHEGRVVVRDFGSTNGTSVNEVAVDGEKELKDGDQLRVGPLEFRVSIAGRAAAAKKPAKVGAAKAAASLASAEDDLMAAMLLEVNDDDRAAGPHTNVDGSGVPAGSTVMEILKTVPGDTSTGEPGKPDTGKNAPVKPSTGNTSSAAEAILQKYMRRPRG